MNTIAPSLSKQVINLANNTPKTRRRIRKMFNIPAGGKVSFGKAIRKAYEVETGQHELPLTSYGSMLLEQRTRLNGMMERHKGNVPFGYAHAIAVRTALAIAS